MHNNFHSIILFGSQARKDHDISSDLDICILTKSRESHELKQEDIEKVIGSIEGSNLTLVCYPDAAVDSMLENGSLFLWHLKLEGKVLYGDDYFVTKIRKLKPFKTHFDEVIYHSKIFQDLQNSWHFLQIPNEFDLSILFTLSRNTCMVLSHKAGKPSFGRLNSFFTAKEFFPDLPMSFDEYNYLARWKIIYERYADVKYTLPKPHIFEKLLSDVDGVLNYALKKLS